MKRMFLILVLGTLVAATGALAQPAMLGSSHDLGTGSGTTGAATNVNKVCVFCHTPHQDATAAAQDPLWNHDLSATAAYGVYGSDTLDATPTELTTAVAGSATVSHLCMSCHDGTVGLGALYNDPNEAVPDNAATNMAAGPANMGTSLVDDHPVNFTYDNALFLADGELIDPDSTSSVDAAGDVPLFGGTLQCASCHDPHNVAALEQPFLVVSNDDSALCVECHTK